MTRDGALAPLLLSRLDDATRGLLEAAGGLEDQLQTMVSEARRGWPSVPLPNDAFLAFVAERLQGEPDPVLTLQQLRAPDMFLACACARHVPEAAEAFRERLFPEITLAIHRIDPARRIADDVQQIVYQKAFVEADQGPPKVRSYKGRGELRNWVRVIALRVGQNLLRDEGKRAVSVPPILLEAVCPEHDLESSYLKQHYQDAFRAAFEAAARSLSSEERNILRFRLQEGLQVDQIAVLYGVHRVTMARRIRAIRESLLQRTRSHLATSLGAHTEEMSSILRLVGSRLDVTFGALSAEGGGPGKDRGA
jgi:RNA polymerase sigma-70 factor, ECF subfamily